MQEIHALKVEERVSACLTKVAGKQLSGEKSERLREAIKLFGGMEEAVEEVRRMGEEALAKLIYVVESVFVTLCFHGFCGSEEDEQEQRQGEEEWKDGTGIGEGQGEEDVSKEIEHEEQVEGLQGDEQTEKEEKADQQPN